MPKKTLGFCALLCTATSAHATENLMEFVDGYNITMTDNVVHQTTADTIPTLNWKIQIWYDNDRHSPLPGTSTITYDQLNTFVDNTVGFISYTFTTPNDLQDLKYFRYGLNGRQEDTLVFFNIKDVQPYTTYTLQWRVLNTTQGEIAWTDMRVVHCTDGYKLPLGGTNCEQLCTTGITHLRAGGARHILYQTRPSTPALHVQYNNQVCYGSLAPGTGAGLNLWVNNTAYHLTD